MSIPPREVVDYLENRISAHFAENIPSNLRVAGTEFYNFSTIYREYTFYMRNFCQIFGLLERYIDVEFRQMIQNSFIVTCKNCFAFEEISECVFNFISNVIAEQLPGEMHHITSCSKLIETVFEDQFNSFVHRMCQCVRYCTQHFVASKEDQPVSVFIDSVTALFNFQKDLSWSLFEDEEASHAIRLACYRVIIESNTFEKCVSNIAVCCEARTTEFITRLYHCIDFCEPSDELLAKVANSVKSQLDKEAVVIPDVSQTIEWYTSMVRTAFGNNPTIQKHFREMLTSFLNRDVHSLFKDIMNYIAVKANGDADISTLQPVLIHIANKDEFEMFFSKNSALRLIPVSEKRIETEKKIVMQIKESCTSFELRNYSEVLREALISLEYHIGPVIVVSSSLWPFRPPYTGCIALMRYTDQVTSLYQKMFPTRMLRFPAETWNLRMKDTVSGVTISGNGVQAEIMIYMNNHRTISEDAFEPHIPAVIVKAALRTLATKKFPLFCRNKEGIYRLNPDFKKTVPEFRLARPVVSESANIDAQLSHIRDDALDSEIMRIMKSTRILTMKELESRASAGVSVRFSVNYNDVRSRITSLTSRGFIEVKPDGQVVYAP